MSRSNASPEHGGGSPPAHRHVFSPEEDQALAALVASDSLNTWLEIAARMPGRSARQCRDRWTNYLAPTISLDPWTPEEDDLIMRKVEECGTKWAAIAKEIPGRSDNAIKNRWYTALKRKQLQGIAPRPEPKGPPPKEAPPKKTPPAEDGSDFWEKHLADVPEFKEHENKREDVSQTFLEWF
jgi:hypothetical protein